MQSNYSKTDLSQRDSLTKWKSGVAWVGNLITLRLLYLGKYSLSALCDWNDKDFDFKKFKTQLCLKRSSFHFSKPENITEDFARRKAEENTENCKETQTLNSLELGKPEKETRKKLWNWHIQKRWSSFT